MRQVNCGSISHGIPTEHPSGSRSQQNQQLPFLSELQRQASIGLVGFGAAFDSFPSPAP
jgi:hypothetical protein